MSKKDNSTFRQKLILRQTLLRQIENPVILETHGGWGKLYNACYRHVQRGIVLEFDKAKAAYLAKQRPTWAVYQGKCEVVLAAGAGKHLVVNLVDVDPYGNPWPVIDAFLFSERPRPANLYFAVNDGLRRSVRLNGGWNTPSLQAMVQRYGNGLDADYLEVCRELMVTKAAQAGYTLSRFAGYYTGYNRQMAHYLAVFVNEA